VHYRKAREEYEGRVNGIIDSLLGERRRLKKSSGKKIYEVQPDLEWNKGKALFWLLDALEMKISRTFPIYIGDDTTDEDAFQAIKTKGLGIVVMEQNRKSEADEMLNNTEEVETWLRRLVRVLKGEQG
jgi:trehalose-phosphatase